MVRYFISYSYVNGESFGFGNCEIRAKRAIKSVHDVEALARNYEKDYGYPEKSVVILNFIKLPKSREAVS